MISAGVRTNTVCVATILLLAIVALVRLVSVPVLDLNRYPVVFSTDTWQFISTAFNYLGMDTVNSHRPPLLSIILAGLYSTGLDAYAGVVIQCVWLSMAVPVYVIASKLGGRTAGLIAALLVLTNKQLYAASFVIGTDGLFLTSFVWAVSFLFVENRRSLLLAWSFLGIAYFAHYLPTLGFSFLLAGIYLRGKRVFADRAALWGIFVFSVLLAANLIFFFSWSGREARNEDFIGINNIAILGRYVQMLVYSLNWPVALLAVAGAVIAGRTHRPPLVFAAIWFFPTFLFFSLFYTWPHYRFVAYFIIPVIILAALGLAALAERLPRAGAIAAVFGIAAWANLVSQAPQQWSVKDMVLTPGFVMNEAGEMHRQMTPPALYHYFVVDPEQLRKQELVNIYPDDVLRLAALIRERTRGNEYFTFFPHNWRIDSRLVARLHPLSERRHRQFFTEADLHDPARKLIIFIQMRESGADPESDVINIPHPAESYQKVLFYLANSGEFVYLGNIGIFHVYERK